MLDASGSRAMDTERPPECPSTRWNKLSPKQKEEEVEYYKRLRRDAKKAAHVTAYLDIAVAGRSPEEDF